jgi:signal transduction histidine kinase/ligand-binding sensor domain-containing protein
MPKSFWLITWLSIRVAFALDPQKPISQFIHTSWTEQQGAPDDIRALAQTADGYLWLGTTNGLFHFDGVRFARFEPRPGEQFPAFRVRSLLATRDGALWIVFAPGTVSRLLAGHVTSYSERDGLPATFGLAEQSDGALIAGTAKGLLRFRKGMWQDAGTDWDLPRKPVRQVYPDKAGELWVLTDDRVLHFPAGQTHFIDTGEPIGAAGNLAQSPDGTIWIPETGRSAHNVRRSGDDAPLTEVRVGASCLLFDRDGSLWIGSGGDGLRRVANPTRIVGQRIAQFGPEAEQFTGKDGLSGDYVRSVLEDREGNIWWGTLHGLDRFRESTFTPVALPHSDVPRSLLAERDGSVWVFSLNPVGIVRIGPQGNRDLVAQSSATAMGEDESGGTWLVTARALYRFQAGRPLQVALRGGLSLKAPVAITADRSGGIWFLDQEEGLFRFAQGKLKNIGHASDPVYPWGYLYTDRAGRVWLAAYDHVTRYDNEAKSQEFGVAEGVPPGPIFTIYEDSGGHIWVGGDGGLSRVDGDRLNLLSKTSGFPARSVYGMAEDDDGSWWIASDLGVLSLPAHELDRAVGDPDYRVRYQAFNVLDGLPGKPRKTFPMPVITRSADGRIWFATSNGIAFRNPGHIPRNSLPPPVLVEAVKIDGKEMTPSEGMELGSKMNDVEIDYTALSLSIPERVLFRYRLEGADSDWRNAGTRRQAFYNRLGPGHYRFRVIACNNDGVWNEAGATLGFVVAPTFFQTRWFLAGCAGLVLSSLWGLYRLRLRQIAEQFDLRLEARVGERTRIARELHDHLLQSFHGLMLRFQLVQKMLPDRPLEAGKALKVAIDRAAQAITEGRDAVQELRTGALDSDDLVPALTALGEEMAAIHTEDGSGHSASTFRLLVEGTPEPLHPILQEDLYHIAREAVGNAFRHARAKSIEVDVRFSERLLRLRVRDDGIGMESGVAREGRAGHWGLAGMRERAKNIGAPFELWSEAGAGTEIEIVIPATIAYRRSRAAGEKRETA